MIHRGMKREGWRGKEEGGDIQHVHVLSRRYKQGKKHLPKDADLHCLLIGTNSHLLLLTLPQSSALHSPEKRKDRKDKYKG